MPNTNVSDNGVNATGTNGKNWSSRELSEAKCFMECYLGSDPLWKNKKALGKEC